MSTTVAGGSGDDLPGGKKGNEKWRIPKSKALPPTPKKQSRKKNAQEIGRSRSSGIEYSKRTSSRASSRSSKPASASAEQLSGGKLRSDFATRGDVEAEQDSDDCSSLQKSGTLDVVRTVAHRSRGNSGVSSLTTEDRERIAGWAERGAPSPVSLPSRSNSTGIRPTDRRSSLLSEIQEESPITPGESWLESLSPTSLRRRPAVRRESTPYRNTRPLPMTGRSLSESGSSEQARTASPTNSDVSGWSPNPLQHRDTIRAGRERHIPLNLDIQAASGSILDRIESRTPYSTSEEDSQLHDEDATNQEPSLPTRRRPVRRRSQERSSIMDDSSAAARTMRTANDASDVFGSSLRQRAQGAIANSYEWTRAGDDDSRGRFRVPDSSNQTQQRPAAESPTRRRRSRSDRSRSQQSREAEIGSQTGSQRRGRGSEAPRTPTRADSNSPSATRVYSEMSDRERAEFKKKGIPPRMMYPGT